MIAPLNYQSIMAKRISEKRRSLGSKSLRVFAKVYLQEHCLKSFSPMHIQLFEDLERIIHTRNGRLAVAAPRGHAKSTIVSLAFVLWCILYEKEQLILIVSNTRDQAIRLLGHVKEELVRNKLLMEDFPELCRREFGKGSGRQPKPWRDNRILLSNGVMVCAYGAQQSLRGARHGNQRPGLIIVDDIEEQEAVQSEEMRFKLRDWFMRTLLHAGHTTTNVIIVGTILHCESLLANLTNPSRSAGWTARKYKAVQAFSAREDLWQQWLEILTKPLQEDEASDVDALVAATAFFEGHRDAMLEGTQVLWPENDPYYDLMLMRERNGRASFMAEKQNEPLNPQLAIFQPDDIHYWNDKFSDVDALLRSLAPYVEFYGACDPSLGHPERGDETAIVILAKKKGERPMYVIEADIRRRQLNDIVGTIVSYARKYKFTRFGFESNVFQETLRSALAMALWRSNMGLVPTPIIQTTNKALRFHRLQPTARSREILFARQHRTLIDQMLNFPLAKYDDGIDALEMAVGMVGRRRRTGSWAPMVHSHDLQRKDSIFDSSWFHT